MAVKKTRMLVLIALAACTATCTAWAHMQSACLREATFAARAESIHPSSGATIELPSFDGAVVRISLGDRRVSSTGVVSYGGRTAGSWLNDASVVMVPGGFVATVSSAEKASRLTFTVCGGKVALRESAMSCGGRCGAPQHVHKTSRRAPGLAAAQVMQPLTGDPLVDGRDIMAAGETVTNVIDLLVGFDKSAAEWVRTRSAFAGLPNATGLFAADAVERCNAVYANTGLNEFFTFNLAGVVEVGSDMSRAKDSNGDIDVYAILNSVSGWENDLPDAYMADCKKVRDAREESCADIVTFLVACGDDDQFGYVGLAFSLNDTTICQLRHRDYAYNVCMVEAVASGYTMPHEIGHLMGAGHAEMWRRNAETGNFELDDGESGQSGPQLYDYSRGYYFFVNNDDVAIQGVTAMGYNFDGQQGAYNWGERWGMAPDNALFPADWNSGLHTVTPFFSSSRHTYLYESRDGDGNAVMVDSGVPLGDATHDNTRILSKTFPLAANYRVRRNVVVLVDPAGGAKSLSGGGSHDMGAVASLKAVANTGFVFAGWYLSYDDASGEYSNPLESADGVDSRSPAVKFRAPSELGKTVVYARFVTPAYDAAHLRVNVADATTDEDGCLLYTFGGCVESPSQPKLAVSGLPTGLKFDSKSMVISGQATKPGIYVVKVKATNASDKKGVEGTFEIKVRNLLPKRFKDAGLVDSYLCWAGVAPESLSGVISKVKAGGWKLALSGLPSGLKYDDAKGTIAGVASKEVRSTVYFTATKDKEKQVATATFEVVFPTLTLKREAYRAGGASGKVSGDGSYPKGKKVTLKATPDSGCVFVGWREEGSPEFLSQSASYSCEMPDVDVTFVAVFATTKQDADNVSLSVNGTSMSSSPGGSPATTNVVCGVAVNWPLAVTALSATTVKVAGLPSGLKFTDKGVLKKGSKTEYDVPPNTIYGAPAAASKVDAKKGVVPSDVKVTVTTAGKTVVSYAMSVTVDPLPPWAVGNFKGLAKSADGASAQSGGVTMSVTAAGKVSGKAVLDGVSWTFKADSYSAVECRMSETEGPMVTNFILRAEATAGKDARAIELDVARIATDLLPDSATARAAGSLGDVPAELLRLPWADKTDPAPARVVAGYAGAYSCKVAVGGKSGVADFTLDEKGGVKGTVSIPSGTKGASFSANALPCEDGQLYVALATPPDAKSGRPAVCEMRRLEPCSGSDEAGVAHRNPGVVLSVWERTEGSGATGTVSANPKYGQVAAGKEVTLTAKADKESVFYRWEIEPSALADGKDLSSPSLKLRMDGGGDIYAKAVFVTKKEDADKVELKVNGTSMSSSPGGSPATTNIYCGVAVDWPVGVTALSKTTVKVSGLPSGLKLVQDKATGAYSVAGVPTAASKVDSRTHKVAPSKVVFTATTAGKSSRTFSVDIYVDALPDWVFGAFDGVVRSGGDDAPAMVGTVSLAIAANGKVSGKMLEGGRTWTLSATSFSSVDGLTFLAAVVGKSGKDVTTNEIAVVADGTVDFTRGVASGRTVSNPSLEWTAWQNLWKAQSWNTMAKDFAKAPVLPVGEVSLKFASSGTVTASGKFVTGKDSKGKDVIYSASCSSALIPQGGDEYKVYIYFPPKAGKFVGLADEIMLEWDAGAKAFIWVKAKDEEENNL